MGGPEEVGQHVWEQERLSPCLPAWLLVYLHWQGFEKVGACPTGAVTPYLLRVLGRRVGGPH